MSVHDFIHEDWQDCIKIYTNDLIKRNTKPLLKYIEANSFSDPNHQQRTICRLKDKTAVLLEQGDVYDWHSDSFSFEGRQLSNPRRGRYWTRIIYLTEGKPLEIGDWNPTGNLEADFDYPTPNEVIARIYPSPGKTVTFPCFMVHRIQPTVDNKRWTFVDFLTSVGYNGFTTTTYFDLAIRYFNEDFRSELLSSR